MSELHSAAHVDAIGEALDAATLGWRRLLIFAACLMILVLDGLDFQLLAFAAPLLSAEWGVGKTGLSYAIGATLVGMALGAPVGGWLGDRWGAQRSLIVAVLMFAIATLVTAAATGISQLVALRLLSGMGFGAAIPNAMSLASSWSGPHRRGPLIALLTVGTSVGGLAGGVLCAWLLPSVGWRLTFFVSGAMTLAVALALAFLMPGSPEFLVLNGKVRQAWDLVRRIVKQVQLPEPASTPPLRSAPTPSAAAATDNLLNRTRLRTNLPLWFSFFAASYTAYAYLSWSPTIFVDLGMPLPLAIQLTSIFSLASIAGTLGTTVIANRMDSRRVIITALFIIAATAILLLLAMATRENRQLYLLVGLGGLFNGLCITTLYVLAAASYGPALRGRAIGSCIGYSRGGGIVAAFGGGALLSSTLDGRVLFFAAIVGVILPAIAAMAWFRQTPDPN